MKKRFYPYQVSAVIGGVEILAMVRDEFHAQDTVYQGKHLCCGAVVEIDHRSLSQRDRNNHLRCADCRKYGRPVVRVPRAGKQDGPAARFIDEMPLEERPKVPPASEILALYARAERAVRGRV